MARHRNRPPSSIAPDLARRNDRFDVDETWLLSFDWICLDRTGRVTSIDQLPLGALLPLRHAYASRPAVRQAEQVTGERAQAAPSRHPGGRLVRLA